MLIDQVRGNHQTRPLTALFRSFYWIQTNPHYITSPQMAATRRHAKPRPKRDSTPDRSPGTNRPSSCIPQSIRREVCRVRAHPTIPRSVLQPNCSERLEQVLPRIAAASRVAESMSALPVSYTTKIPY